MTFIRYLLLLPVLAFVADTWQPFAIDQHVAVQLPAQPTEADLAKLAPGQNLHHMRMWMARAPEGVCQVMRIPGTATISQADTAGRRAFYAGTLTSLMRNEKGQLLSVTPFPTPAGAGIEFKYKGVHRGTGKRVIKYGRSLLIDSVTYALNFLPIDNQDSTGMAGNEQRRRFFNSITVSP